MQENPKSPNIAPFIIVFLKNFRRNIIRSSHNLISTRFFKLFFHLLLPMEGKSEVDEHDVVIISTAKEEVFRLEIPVANFLEMKIFNGLDHL